MAAEIRHLVVGGGVVGLSVAARLSKEGPTLVVERNHDMGMETSSRNSGVIHAGIYYPRNSIKSRTCIRGKDLLYQFAERYSIPVSRIGKWIVAQTKEEEEGLHRLSRNAKECNVDVEWVSQKDIKNESQLKASSALSSPTTGIICSHSLILALRRFMDDNEADCVFNAQVESISAAVDEATRSQLYCVKIRDVSTGEIQDIMCEKVVNAAGLHAVALANTLSTIPDEINISPTRGRYLRLKGKLPLLKPRLIYPYPEKNLATLGIHATVTIGDDVMFGPDKSPLSKSDEMLFNSSCVRDDGSNSVELIKFPMEHEYDYSFSQECDCIEEMRIQFLESINRYFPTIKNEQLEYGFIGIRPQLAGSSKFKDFVIHSDEKYPGVISLLGIESPGLTASLSLADEVAATFGYHHRDALWDE